MPTTPNKLISASRITLVQMMVNEHANLYGNVHGGVIMKLCDEAGGFAAMRHAGRPCVTVFIDSMEFYEPVHVGELLRITAEPSWIGRTSIECEVVVEAENVMSGHRLETNRAYFVYVALDDRGRPVPVPELDCESDAQRRRMEQGEARRQYRLKKRAEREAEKTAAP